MKKTTAPSGAGMQPSRARARPFNPGRHEQRFVDAPADPYALSAKLPNDAVCKRCGVAYRNGRWQWVPPLADAEAVTCAACRRIEDGIPAGHVHVDSVSPGRQRDEMMRLIRHHEARARLEHPMERVIAIEPSSAGFVVTTTGIHLARDIATAVKEAFGGTLRIAHGKGEPTLRAYVGCRPAGER